ncbi:hypothetical protein CcCBS67573_g09554 [Chytriomyces confervae]|uniref:Reverse transcriptase domain-containing protein n=1 Tax=Chytriomyces confervae TaxID=246404 RepID=A0A507DTK6_9FUNG|nr:hypothetical protein CcCBS67573_g09554 [Chytriomyces confervae]
MRLKKDGLSVLMGGDFNVAAEATDIHPRVIPLISSGFQDAERVLLRALLSHVSDLWRGANPTLVGDFMTWFHLDRRRNEGMRYDMILGNGITALSARHAHEFTGSDHVPVISVLRLCNFRMDFSHLLYDCSSDFEDSCSEASSVVGFQECLRCGLDIQTPGSIECLRCQEPVELESEEEDEDLHSGVVEALFFDGDSSTCDELEALTSNSEGNLCSGDELSVDTESSLGDASVDSEESTSNTTGVNQGKSFSHQFVPVSSFLMGEKTLDLNSHLELSEGETVVGIAMPLLSDSGGLSDTSSRFLGNAKSSVFTKVKRVADKVRPVATSIPGGIKPDDWKPDLKGVEETAYQTRLTEEQLDSLFNWCREYPGFLTDVEIEFSKSRIRRYNGAFAFDLKEWGRLKEGLFQPVRIHTILHVPWNIHEHPIPPAHFPKLIQLLRENLDAKVMEPSQGAYASPWFMVLKKDGSLRFIQDLQLLNKVSVRNYGVPPNMDELTTRAPGYYIYTAADAISFFDQIPVDERDRDMTAIRTPLGLMRMTGLPQGWTGSPSHAQRVSVMIFHKDGECEVFIDDLIVFTGKMPDLLESEEFPGVRNFVLEHLEAVERMLQKLLDSGLTIHGTKNEFFVPEVLTLGVLLSQEGRSVNPAKVDAIMKWEQCRNLAELRSFVGMMTVWQMWIEHFSLVAEPLFRLYWKEEPFVWGWEQGAAFEELKKSLSLAPIRRNLDTLDLVNRPPIIAFDAFLVGEGACLGQIDENRNRFAISFFSGLFNKAERNYPQVKQELCACVRNLKRCYVLVFGYPVLVLETDALALKGMVNNLAIMDATIVGVGGSSTRYNGYKFE